MQVAQLLQLLGALIGQFTQSKFKNYKEPLRDWLDQVSALTTVDADTCGLSHLPLGLLLCHTVEVYKLLARHREDHQ